MDLLQNAIIKKRVAHAYLFEGSKGIRRYACALLRLVKPCLLGTSVYEGALYSMEIFFS